MASSLLPSLIVLLLLVVVQSARLPQPLKLAGRGADYAEVVNDRPIIGILTQPGDPAPEGSSYIAASYVKWVEAAGARVVPIFFDETPDEIRSKFKVINGLLLPGGGARLRPGHPFYDAASQLIELAIQANDAGDYFPVHGTCLGLETLSIVISANYSLLSDTAAEDAPAPLLYTEMAQDSHFFRSLPPSVVRNLANTPIAMENHMHGVLSTTYEENPKFKEFFKLLSLSLDKGGLPYISTIEARKYPITATQWHPEKNQFEWPRTLHIPHSLEAVVMGQEVANFFVREARKNSHAAKSDEEEDDMLIYQYKPEFTGRHFSGKGEEEDFEQTYIFSGPDNRAAAKAARAAAREQQRRGRRAAA